MGCFESKIIEGETELTKDVLLYERKPTTFDQTHANLAERLKHDREIEKQKKKNPKFDPKIIVKYEIKAQIGESGKYTKVFRVENKFTKEPGALKLFTKPEGLAAMECEKAILKRLKHKNIVRLIEVFTSGKQTTHALVLELITGGNLFERIHEKGIFSERAASKVLVQVLDGVQYLHGIYITHRGLTLHNVLFYHQGNNSRVVLTDFATAHTRRSADDTVMRGPCGSREYFAPEVVLGLPYTQSVDVWAVGVITYAILSAEFPFPSRDKPAMLQAISKAEYSMDSEVWLSRSALCRQFVSSLLALDAEQRLTAAAALKHPWLNSRPPEDVPHARGNRSSSVTSMTSSVLSLHHLRPARPTTSLRYTQSGAFTHSSTNQNAVAPSTFYHPSFTTFGNPPRNVPATFGGHSRHQVAAANSSLNDYGSSENVPRRKSKRRRPEKQQSS